MNPQLRLLFKRSAFIATVAYVLFLLLPKEETFLWFNQFTNPVADSFFLAVNLLGDGWMLLPLAILGLFIQYRFSLSVVVLALLILLFVSIGKQWLFSDVLRPSAVIDMQLLDFVDGIAVAKQRSFPSGHTTTAFGIAFLLITVIKQRFFRYFPILLAIFAGYARIYLVQHFPEDVAMGAILGISAAAISVHIGNLLPKKWNGSLIRIRKLSSVLSPD